MQFAARLRVAIDVHIVAFGYRQRCQLRLALADADQVVSRPDIRARAMDRVAYEVIDGGRVHRHREQLVNEARVICGRKR